MTVHSSDTLDAGAVRFIGAAEAYCAAVEMLAAGRNDVALATVHRQLVEVYAAVLALPPMSASRGDDAEQPAHRADGSPRYTLLTHSMCKALRDRLKASLGDDDDFVDVVSPFAPDAELIPVSLAYALANIQQDLLAGLSTWETQGLVYGHWHWRTFFEVSWHSHLSTALRGLEAIARREGGRWPAGNA